MGLMQGRRSTLKSVLALAGAGLALQGCAGGGGGSPATIPTTPTPPSTPVTTTSSAQPGYAVQPQSTEDVHSENSLGPVNAFVPVIRDGVLGQNQRVAVFDTGVDASQPDLAGQVLTTLGFSLASGTQATIITDPDSDTHGTAVTSLIVAARDGAGIEGIAPDAKVVPVQIPEDSKGNFMDLDDAHLPLAINYIAGLGNVHVINNSWNISSLSGGALSIAQYESQNRITLASTIPRTIAAYQNFVNQGNVVVWAAGNEFAAEPDAFAGLPQEVPGLQAGWAVAVAVTPSGTLASYSNACGSTAAWCIAAVGSNVTIAVGTSVSSSGYAIGSGTSFAAPAVAGAIALLMSAAPNITAQQALQILFQTANKTGIYAQTAIYGQGLMDLNQAMQPVGQVTVAAAGITAAPAAQTMISVGGAFGAQPAGALAKTEMVVQDFFKRGYSVDLGARVATATEPFDAGYRLSLFGRSDQTVYSDGLYRVDWVADSDPWRAAPDAAQVHFLTTRTIDANTNFRFGAGIDPARALDAEGSAAADFDHSALAPSSIANPYLSLVDNAIVGAAEFQGVGHMTAAIAFGQPFVGEGILRDRDADTPHMVAGVVQSAFALGEAGAIRVDAGALTENNSLLGSVGGGASRIGRSDSWFAGMTGEIALTRHTVLVAGFHAGLSSETGVAGSMVKNASGIVSLSSGAGLVEYDALAAGDKMTFGVGLPLRALSGHANLLVPETIDTEGTIGVQPMTIALGADGHETDWQWAWMTPVLPGIGFTGGLLLREEPGNVHSAPAEGIVALRVDMAL